MFPWVYLLPVYRNIIYSSPQKIRDFLRPGRKNPQSRAGTVVPVVSELEFQIGGTVVPEPEPGTEVPFSNIALIVEMKMLVASNANICLGD